MTAKRLSLPSVSAILLGSVTLWLSFGTLGVTAPDSGAARIGVLPSPAWLVATLAVVSLVGFIAGERRVRLLWLSAVLLLPWLPFPVPPATYVWTGPLRWALWSAVGTACLAPAVIAAFPAVVVRPFTQPGRAPYLAAVIAALVYLVAAWRIAPQLPGGDEPHYLIIAQSLLEDGDLQIENNHQRGDYREYYAGPLKPDYLARGVNGQIYSVHSPGLPALVAPAFAAAGYPGVLAFLALVGGCAAGLAWSAVWLLTEDIAASWFGWAAVSLSVPFLFQVFIVYPDGLGAALVMAAVVTAILDRRASLRALVATSIALALLPWLHTRFAVTAAALGVIVLVRQFRARDRSRRVAAFLAVPAMSALAWFGLFYAIYGSPNPAAAYGGYTQSALANVPRSVTGFLFDQQFGLLPNAPVYLCAFLGIVPLARRHPRVAIDLALVVIPYTLATALFFMWWGGLASPVRFLVSILLPLAIPAGAWFAQAGRAARVLGLAALAVSILLSLTIAFAGRGELLYNRRDGASRLLRWASPLVSLTTGVPSSFQTGVVATLGRAAVWLLAAALLVALAVWLDRRRVSAGNAAIAIGSASLAAGMVALWVVWTLNAAAPLTPETAGARLLQAIDGSDRQLALRYGPFRRVGASELPPMIPVLSRAAERTRDEPIGLVTPAAAATYTISGTIVDEAGRLAAGVDRQPLWSWNLSHLRGKWSQTFTLPNDARALRIDADPATRAALRHMTVRADRRLAASERASDREAVRGARYGPAAVFLLHGVAYVEPEGVWVGGAAAADFAVVPDAGAGVMLFVRNSAVDNVVTVESGQMRQELLLKPHEERTLELASGVNASGFELHIGSRTGARPADNEPGNQDARLLGCWIETR